MNEKHNMSRLDYMKAFGRSSEQYGKVLLEWTKRIRESRENIKKDIKNKLNWLKKGDRIVV